MFTILAEMEQHAFDSRLHHQGIGLNLVTDRVWHMMLTNAWLAQVMAEVMGAEAALVRCQLVSGTHAIATALFACLRPGDRLLAVAGRCSALLLQSSPQCLQHRKPLIPPKLVARQAKQAQRLCIVVPWHMTAACGL